MASSSDGSLVGAELDKEASLIACIQELYKHDRQMARTALETILKLANNVIQHPDDEKFKKVRTENKNFSAKVWSLPDAQKFLFVWGWTEVDEFLVLPSDNDVQLIKQVLQRKLNLMPGQPNPSTASDVAMSDREKVLQEERKLQLDKAKHEAEEKKRILAQIRADRQNLKGRQLKDSKAQHMHGQGGMTKFGDIGVDLDDGDGG